MARPIYLLAALPLPFIIELPSYILTWVTGLARFDADRWAASLPFGLTASSPVQSAALLLTVGVVESLGTALGEEIGWRGVLVPTLARITSPLQTGFISGAIWSLWTAPAIIMGVAVAKGVPIPTQLLFYSLTVVLLGPVFAWLRLASGSIWPPALAHAFYNVMVQSILDQATVDHGHAVWVIGESGALTPLLTAALLLMTWRRLATRSCVDDRANGN